MCHTQRCVVLLSAVDRFVEGRKACTIGIERHNARWSHRKYFTRHGSLRSGHFVGHTRWDAGDQRWHTVGCVSVGEFMQFRHHVGDCELCGVHDILSGVSVVDHGFIEEWSRYGTRSGTIERIESYRWCVCRRSKAESSCSTCENYHVDGPDDCPCVQVSSRHSSINRIALTSASQSIYFNFSFHFFLSL